MGKQARLKRERREARNREDARGNDARTVERELSKLIEQQRESLDAEELAMLDEMLEAARVTIQLYHKEAQARLQSQGTGESVPKRWQVAPGVFRALSSVVLRLMTRRKELTGEDPGIRKAS